MPFDGLRILSLESRRAGEMSELIRRQQGEPFAAPSMREAPLEDNQQAFTFAERLFDGGYDMLVFLTGVGTRALDKVISSRYPSGQFAGALRSVAVVARGPKPAAALREMSVPVTINVPEPNTWRELLLATEGRPEKHIAVQEYGKSNLDLLDGLRARGAEVTPVRVYQWALPEDTGPLRAAVHKLAGGEVDVVLFTTSIQADHLFRIAAEEHVEAALHQALSSTVVASIGPTTTEALEEFGIHPDLEPSHPRMGFLVKESAEQAHQILARKRGAHAER